jgi:hypothetical protein
MFNSEMAFGFDCPSQIVSKPSQSPRKDIGRTEMAYRISYIDTSVRLAGEQRPEGLTRTEDYPTEPAALVRARELLESVNCHGVLITDGGPNPVGGVCLQLKVGLASE